MTPVVPGIWPTGSAPLAVLSVLVALAFVLLAIRGKR